MNGNGMEKRTTDQKEDGMLQKRKMIRIFKETNHQVFTSVSALSRGIPKQVNNKTSIHFNAEMTNSELLLKIIFSASTCTSDHCSKPVV